MHAVSVFAGIVEEDISVSETDAFDGVQLSDLSQGKPYTNYIHLISHVYILIQCPSARPLLRIR